MYTLYSAENSYSMTAQVMLEELELIYELKWVTIHIPLEDKDSEWIALNPNGKVPTLIYPDGSTQYETAAILISLAEENPNAGLIPLSGDPLRRLYWQWHFYLISSMQPEEMNMDSPDRYFSDELKQDELRNASIVQMRKVWQTLDNEIGDGEYILGDCFTTVDISFAMQACWKEAQPPEGLAEYSNARRVLNNVLSRPSARKVLKDHNVLFQSVV